MEGPTILIVDDEEKNIKLVKAMLMSEDYHTIGVLSGEEALKIVDQQAPDVILLDVMMPGIDGFEVCKRLKQDEETKGIPILMATALRDREHRIRAMESGADDFLSKPLDKTELLIRVKSLLRIKTYHDELLEKYQEISEKNDMLQELEKTKEGLTHMIIHDLRNPLMAISGHVELITIDKARLSESQARAAQNCLNFCRDLNLQIDSLLDIHKMEEVTVAPDREITDLAGLTDEILIQFRPKVENKNIEFSFSTPDSLPPAKVGRGLIKRVMANLFGNAIRHTPKEGKIEGTIRYDTEKACFFFNLRDSGDGLDPRYNDKIFHKFEQIELRKAGIKVGSSGLGLAFCKMAIEAHGGKIWVESEGQNTGCNFCFMIPADAEGIENVLHQSKSSIGAGL
ncbi:MAG: response regulator [Deltaproteobacteria bacterium]|nr:response regulator [Deltaproteobacteria bacterium]